MIASPSMSVAFWWQCVTSKTRLETPVCVPLHSVALSVYEDVSRSSPCPSHPLYRHINGQMSSNSESPLRSIKKATRHGEVSKKVLNVRRNSVTPPVKVRIWERAQERALALQLCVQSQALLNLAPLWTFLCCSRATHKQPWMPLRRRCRCSSSTRRTPWTEPSRPRETKRQRRTGANRSAVFEDF